MMYDLHKRTAESGLRQLIGAKDDQNVDFERAPVQFQKEMKR